MSKNHAITLYFDLEDPQQAECYKLMCKAGRKKTCFAGIMAHEFLQSFNNSDVDNLPDNIIKNYITAYPVLCRLKKENFFANPMIKPLWDANCSPSNVISNEKTDISLQKEKVIKENKKEKKNIIKESPTTQSESFTEEELNALETLKLFGGGM